MNRDRYVDNDRLLNAIFALWLVPSIQFVSIQYLYF